MKLGLLLILLVPVAAAQVNLSFNETYVFNFTNEVNLSVNESFYCGGDLSPLLLNLTSGQTVTQRVGFCSATASCAPSVTNQSASCVVQRTLGSGERFVLKEGTCDIDIQGPVIVNDSRSVPQRQSVSVRKDGDVLKLTVGERSFDIPVTSNSFSYDQVVELSCPAQPEFQETDDVDYLVTQCRSWVPMLDDTISTLVQNTRTCSDSASRHVSDLKESSARERDLLGQVGTLQAQLEAAGKERDAALNEASSARSAMAEAEARALSSGFLAWLFAGLFVAASAAIYVLVRKGGAQ